jgi:hypothetical protein
VKKEAGMFGKGKELRQPVGFFDVLDLESELTMLPQNLVDHPVAEEIRERIKLLKTTRMADRERWALINTSFVDLLRILPLDRFLVRARLIVEKDWSSPMGKEASEGWSKVLKSAFEKLESVSIVTHENQDKVTKARNEFVAFARAKSSIWDVVNGRNYVKSRLWSLTARVSLSLLVVYLIADCFMNGKVIGNPVVQIAFFGAIGGILSSMLKIRDTRFQLRDYNIHQTGFLVQPITGAVMAVIVYHVFLTGIISGPGSTPFPVGDSFSFTVALGFVSGFSERFFIRTLDAFAEKAGGDGAKQKKGS